MLMTIQTHQGRFGFHPCDFETFQKLKEAHRLLLRAYRDCKRFIRWHAKMEHNRQGPEPTAPAEFIERGVHRLDKHCFYGDGFLRTPDAEGVLQNYYLHILRQLQLARHPKPTPEEVIPLHIPDDLDVIVERLRDN